MQTTRDLTTVLGDFGLAKQLAPGFAQLKFANQAVYGGHGMDFSENQLRSLEKIIEMKGGFKSPGDFLGQASMMQQVIAGTGGMVKPSDYLAFIKTAGVAGRLLDNKSFYYGMEPLIQEMGGNRVGTGLMSAYNNLAQGRSTVRAATELMKLGLLDPSMVDYTKIGTIKQVRPGALKDTAGFGSNPYQWMQEMLLPAMRARGITSEQGVLQEMGVHFRQPHGLQPVQPHVPPAGEDRQEHEAQPERHGHGRPGEARPLKPAGRRNGDGRGVGEPENRFGRGPTSRSSSRR